MKWVIRLCDTEAEMRYMQPGSLLGRAETACTFDTWKACHDHMMSFDEYRWLAQAVPQGSPDFGRRVWVIVSADGKHFLAERATDQSRRVLSISADCAMQFGSREEAERFVKRRLGQSGMAVVPHWYDFAADELRRLQEKDRLLHCPSTSSENYRVVVLIVMRSSDRRQHTISCNQDEARLIMNEFCSDPDGMLRITASDGSTSCIRCADVQSITVPPAFRTRCR